MSVTRRVRTLECEFEGKYGTFKIVRCPNGDINTLDNGCEAHALSEADAITLAQCLHEVATGDPNVRAPAPEKAGREVVVDFDYYKDASTRGRRGTLVGADDRHLFIVERGQYKSFLRENVYDLRIVRVV